MKKIKFLYNNLIDKLRSNAKSAKLAELIPEILDKAWDCTNNGNLPRWLDAYDSLPDLSPGVTKLNTDTVKIGESDDLDEELRKQLKSSLEKLIPWRKGPFDFFGTFIDTEWRSDWKWKRLEDKIAPLKGRKVLDIGCGNGYHCFRSLGAGASFVFGVDTSMLSTIQFLSAKKYLRNSQIHLLPTGFENLPEMNYFDTVFSMGVLYHCKSPIDHILKMKSCLRDGGELLMETIILNEPNENILFPEKRYGRMRNVWFIPTVPMLEKWLKRCEFKNIKTINVCKTTCEEQRATDWMRFMSLKDFLDPENDSKTIEGYPAPFRAVLTAEK